MQKNRPRLEGAGGDYTHRRSVLQSRGPDGVEARLGSKRDRRRIRRRGQLRAALIAALASQSEARGNGGDGDQADTQSTNGDPLGLEA